MSNRTAKPLPPRTAGGLYTAEEVAAELRVSVETVYGLCRNGEIEAMRIGMRGKGTWRITEMALQDYMKRATLKPIASGEFQHIKVRKA